MDNCPFVWNWRRKKFEIRVQDASVGSLIADMGWPLQHVGRKELADEHITGAWASKGASEDLDLGLREQPKLITDLKSSVYHSTPSS